MNFTTLVRRDLREFQPYRSARKEANTGRIWMNANESPWNNNLFPDEVLLNRYPEPQPQSLLKALANYYQTTMENLLITRGSDEAIDLLIRLFCEPQRDSIMIFPPTYGMYEISAKLQGANVLEIPLLKSEGFQLDISAILNSWNPTVKLIFICSPNNPTGNLISEAEILLLCKNFSDKSMVVVDEAYIEYAERDSLVRNISIYKNLVVLRTFSKALGLAGIRCGTLIGDPPLVGWLNKIIAPYPISKLTEVTANNMLSEENLKKIYVQVRCVNKEKNKLASFFNNHIFVKTVWKSHANFLLVEVKSIEKWLHTCSHHGIVLRNVSDKYGLENCIRVSIGLPEENALLMKTLMNI